jgi:hypothetical protein
VTVLAQRLLGYAGLPQLRPEVGLWSDMSPQLRARSRTHGHGTTAALFLGLDGDCARFAVEAGQLDDPESMVAAMAHEVAHAWRARHGEVVEDQRHEEELTDLTTVYLGFGVLTSNAAYRYRSRGGHPVGTRSRLLTSASLATSRAVTRRCCSDRRWDGRYDPLRQASASARASRRSVFTRRVLIPYMGAKFGSATITSCPRSSRQRATHSLSVDASTSTFARGRPPSTAPNRSRVVAIRTSVTSPSGVRMHTWDPFLCTSMPTWLKAGLHSLRL